MKTKPRIQRGRFTSDWREVDYLYHKLLYWLYERQSVQKARPYAERLERLLPKLDPHHEAILSVECWSLVYETKRDLRRAIEYRENEIRLMHRLHEISPQPIDKCVLLEGRRYQDLSDRLDLLASLYHEEGDIQHAIAVLRESKQLCAEQRLKFDGSAMLEQYLAESEVK
ncbi:MAG: hypothetical protein ACREJM_04350, partial [Candidatus Saccharimonadales bacterium]